MAEATDSLSQGDAGSASEKFIDKLKDDGLQRVRTTQRSAADQLEGVAAAIDRAGSELDDSQPTLAHFAGRLAGGVSSFATRIKEGSLDELTTDAQRFAKSNPALFLLGSVGLGVVLARFLKASASSQRSTGASRTSAGANQSSTSYSQANSSEGSSRTFGASPEDSGVFDDRSAAGAVPDLDRGEGFEDSQEKAGVASVQNPDVSVYHKNGSRDV